MIDTEGENSREIKKEGSWSRKGATRGETEKNKAYGLFCEVGYTQTRRVFKKILAIYHHD
jgi:hypothetical protein